jgi:hypothetical protein
MSQPGRAALPGGGSGKHPAADARPTSVVSSSDKGVVLLEVAGSFPTVAATANAALRRAVSRHPVAVVCDLTAVEGAPDEGTLAELTDTGGYLEHWPGCRLILVIDAERADRFVPKVRRVVISSRGDATLAVSDVPSRRSAQIRLTPHPRSSRAARDFVSRTCLDWRLVHGMSSAVLCVSELVTNSLSHAGTDIEVALSSVGPRLLLAVHDGSSEMPRLLRSRSEHGKGRGMHIVAGFSHAWGSLPAPDGGKAVWVVIHA